MCQMYANKQLVSKTRIMNTAAGFVSLQLRFVRALKAIFTLLSTGIEETPKGRRNDSR